MAMTASEYPPPGNGRRYSNPLRVIERVTPTKTFIPKKYRVDRSYNHLHVQTVVLTLLVEACALAKAHDRRGGHDGRFTKLSRLVQDYDDTVNASSVL